MALHDRLGDCESEAAVAVGLGAGTIRAVEAVKKPRQVFGRDARPPVGDFQHATFRGARRFQPYGSTRRGMEECVREKVLHHHRERVRIAMDRGRGKLADDGSRMFIGKRL